jgi:hypothetical protein
MAASIKDGGPAKDHRRASTWLPRLAVFGFAWAYFSLCFLTMFFVFRPESDTTGPLIFSAYVALKFSLCSRPAELRTPSTLISRLRRRAPMSGGLWDQQIDGYAPAPSAKPLS